MPDRKDPLDPSNDSTPAPDPKAKPGKRKRKLRPESLEDRILLSGTWVDADTGDEIGGPSAGNDLYTGSDASDIAESGAGDDELWGGQGDDYLDGGSGDDVLHGEAGDDVVFGGTGNDTLSGGAGDDLLIGGAGTDTATYEGSDSGVDANLGTGTATGEGTDSLIGIENLTGSAHDDTLTGDDNANVIVGGGGDDTIDGAGGNDTLIGGDGADTIQGGSGDDNVQGGADNDILDGGSGNDTVDGGEGDDLVQGGAGNDTLIGGLGDDDIQGGTGTDTVDYTGAANGVNVNLSTGTATGEGTDTISGVENIDGSAFDDVLTGDANANVIDGGAGHDVIDGGAGNDTLRGGAGNDVITGGAGADTIEGGSGDDVIHADELDTISGGSGNDTVNFSGASAGVTFDPTTSDVENVIGSNHDDVFTFTAPNNGESYTINGGAGYNVIDLSAYDAGDLTVDHDAGTVTVDLGGGQLFEIEFSNIDHFIVADAGGEPGVIVNDFVANESSTVQLNALGVSSDTTELSYSWTQVSGPSVTLNNADTMSPTFSSPELSASTTMRFAVEVTDGTTTTLEYVTVGIAADNDPVIVNEGPDQIVSEGDVVTFNASTVDPEGAGTIQSWTQVSGPAVELSDADTLSPSFTAPDLEADTDLVFEIEVSDGENTTTKQVVVTVQAANQGPVVGASDVDVAEGDLVTLNADATDPENGALTYSWVQVSGPAVTLDDATAAEPTFTAPNGSSDSVIEFELTVSDGVNETVETVLVNVAASDEAPQFVAAPNLSVGENEVVTLGATAVDPEGDPVTYTWVQTGGPSVTLSDAGVQNPTFTSPDEVVNTYITFEVTASDGEYTSTRRVDVLVNADNDAPTVDAGNDVTIDEGTQTVLTADAADPEGKGLAYTWTQIGGPDANIASPNSASTAITAPGVDGDAVLTFQVEVSDGTTTTIDTVTVNVTDLTISGDGDIDGTGDDDEIAGGDGDDNISGGDGDDVISGGDGDDVLDGGAGNDTLISGSGDVTMIGGDGDDVFLFTGAEDGNVFTVDGGAGNDTIDLREFGEENVTLVSDTQIVVDLGGGESFTINHVNVETILTADATIDTGTGDQGPPIEPDPDPDPDPVVPDVTAPEGGVAQLSVADIPTVGDATYSWSLVSGSEPVSLIDGDTATPSFQVPEMVANEIYIFEATITDDNGPRTVTVKIQLEGDNDAATVEIDDDATQVSDSFYSIGSEASDPEGQNLAYNWVQVGGPDVGIVRGNTPSLLFSTANLAAPADLTFELQVSDGTNVTTELVTITATPGNTAPSIDAGPDQNVTEGDTVQLASAASDADKDPLTYNWVQVSGPAVTLDDPSAAAPTFDVPNLAADDVIEFQLEVSDGKTTVTDTVTINVSAVNDPPTVDAGPFQSVTEGDLVTLGATGADPESEALTYTWTQVGGPAVTLDGDDTTNPTFTAPEDLTNTYLTFEVEASDGVNTVIDRVVVLVNADNDAPTLDAGPDQVVDEETLVQLNATADDPEDKPLTTTWVQTAGPAVTLSDPNALDPTFTAPNLLNDTDITFQVTTTDGENTVVDTITVTVLGENDASEPTNATSIVTEDTTGTITLSATDPDLGDEIESYRIDTLPGTGTLTLDGVPVNAGDIVTVAQIDAGELEFTPVADYSGTTSFTFSSFDGEAWSAGAATQSVVVVGEADAPIFTTADTSGTEDTPMPLSFDVEVADTDGSETITKIQITGAPVGTVFTDGVTTVTAWDGTADVTALDTTNITMTPGPDHDTDFVLTINATVTEADGDTTVGAATVNVHVDAVNDPPITVDGSVSVSEDTTATIDISALEVDTGDSIKDFRIDTLPTNGTLELNGNPVNAGDTIKANHVLQGKLKFVPDGDWSGSTSFEFSAFDGDVWSDDPATFTINVGAVADAADITVNDAFVIEDGSAALDIGATVTDTDGSESISQITITGAPVGSVFYDGVNTAMSIGDPIDVTGWDLDNLRIAPTPNYDTNFDLSVNVTTEEASNGHQTTASDSLTVNVTAVNDAPIVNSGSMTVSEDGTGAVLLSVTEYDSDDLVVDFRIDSLPEGGTLYFNGAPVDTMSFYPSDQVEGGALTFVADPDWSGTTELTFRAWDGETWSDMIGVHTITVEAVADAPVIDASDVSGNEDTAIALDIDADLIDTDGSETLTVTLSGVPDGAALSAGTDLGGGVWSIDPDDLAGLEITPPTNYSGDLTITINATSTEPNGDTATTSQDVTVSVEAVADAPTLSAGDVSGDEDAAIALNIASALTDTDGSETLSVTVSGVPVGASLSAGVDNGDGTWTLTSGQLAGLSITPPADFSGSFDLDVTSTSTEPNGDTATTTDSFTVNVAAKVEGFSFDVEDVTGAEDTPVALDISAALTSDTDTDEHLEVTLSGFPSGTTFSAGVDNGDGTWTIQDEDLAGLSLTPPADFSGTFDITAVATDTDAGGDSSTQTESFSVTIEAVADAPVVNATDVSAIEDSPVPLNLNIDADLVDTDGSETLTVTLAGVPDGAALSAGTDLGGGVWSIDPADLASLEITPPANYSGDLILTVNATSTEPNGDTATTSHDVTVSIEAVADAPTLSTSDVSGQEDTAIALDIASALTDTDGSETLSVTVSGVPTGASLSAGVDNGDGTWTLASGDLGGLTFTPPLHFTGEIDLSVTATATEGNGDTASVSAALNIEVTGVADGFSFGVNDVSGLEDTAIDLDISAELDVTSSGETLVITLDGFPEGTTFSAGVDNGDGTWSVPSDALSSLTLTPPTDYSGEFTINATAVNTDTGGDTITQQLTFDVTVEAVADAPVASVSDASGLEDTPIPLDLSVALSDTDGSETLGAVTISGVPEGVTFSAGVNNGDGTWTLKPETLAGLTLTAPENFSGSFDLTLTATATEDGGDSTSISHSFTVSVDDAADAPNLSVADVSGLEDTPIALDIASSLNDVDGSESLAITVNGVPNGATLSAGIDNGDGTWTLTADQLTGLSITPPTDYSGDFTLQVTATATDGSDTAVESRSLTVSVEGVADAPSLDVTDATGSENNAIDLDIASKLKDTDGSETLNVVIRGLPDGASLSAGVDNGDGTWSLDPDQLAGLKIMPPMNFAGEIELTITASSLEADGDIATTQQTLTVTVEDVPEAGTETDDPDAEPAPRVNPGEIDWAGDEDLRVISDTPGVDATLEQIELQSNALNDPTGAGEDVSSLDYELIGEVPPLETDTTPLDDVPPPSEPLFEVVQKVSSERTSSDTLEETEATAQLATENELEASSADGEKVEQQFGKVFGMLWGLVRSIGPRQSGGDQNDEGRGNRR
ncbi:MAG: Ig-like domain-containing protein [Phycisphaerales bacterium]